MDCFLGFLLLIVFFVLVFITLLISILMLYAGFPLVPKFPKFEACP